MAETKQGHCQRIGVSVSTYVSFNDTPLHKAARDRNVHSLQELLLSSEVNVNEFDDQGNTPLHSLLAEVCPGESYGQNAALCLKCLLDAGADVNVLNGENHVPLFLAVKNDWEDCVKVLLESGADTAVRLDKGNKSLALYIAENLPNAFPEVLDNAVERGCQGREDVLFIDFSSLLQFPVNLSLENNSQKNNFDETEFLHSLLNIPKATRLFEHPVTTLFMRIKYRKLRNPIWASILLHILTLLFYTAFVIYLYIHVCPYDQGRKHTFKNCTVGAALKRLTETNYSNTSKQNAPRLNECGRCEKNVEVLVMSSVLSVIWVIMISSEIIIWKYRPWRDVHVTTSIFWFTFYVLMPITLWPSLDDDYYILTWRYPTAAMGIWLIWALFVLQLEKLPKLGEFMVMFKKVSIKVVLLASLFLPLLFGFSLGFYVMGANNIESEYSFVTLISIMVGGPDYDEFFDKSENRERSIVYRGVAILIYLLFVVLMCVVFINFLLGLTISDVEELWEEALIAAKKDQIRLMYLFDRIKFKKIQIFTNEDIMKNRLKFVVNIKNHPSYISHQLIQKLKQLAIRENSLKKKLNGFRNNNVSTNGVAINNYLKNSEVEKSEQIDNLQIMKAIKALETQIQFLTKTMKLETQTTQMQGMHRNRSLE